MAKPRIMIVEDEVVVAMELESRLNELGYVVTGNLGRGEEVMGKVKETVPDLVLMDINLSGEVDGVEAARRIREAYDIPVVYLTALSDEKTLQRAKSTGPFGYLVKPFVETELRATIEVSLHKHVQHNEFKASSRWFSTASSLLGGALIVTDENGVVQHMNSSAQTLTGWNHEEATGKMVGEVYELKERPLAMRLRQTGAIHEEEHSSVGLSECVLVSIDGAEIPVWAGVVPAKEFDGPDWAFIHHFREKSLDAAECQDWFSHAANLRILGSLSITEEKYGQARCLLMRALEVFQQNLGSDHPKLAGLLEEVAGISDILGRRGEAQMLGMRAQRIRLRNASP